MARRKGGDEKRYTTFVFYTQWAAWFKEARLSEADIVAGLDSASMYAEGKPPDVNALSPGARTVYAMMKLTIELDKDKYERRVEQNYRAAMEGVRARQEKAKERDPAASREPAAMEAMEKSFDRFWELYPRKVGRDAAFREWQKVGPDEKETENIIRGLQRNIDNELRDRPAKYIPNPATWLKGGNWKNEYGAPESGTRKTHSAGFDDTSEDAVF